MPTVDPEFIYLSDILLPRDPQKALHAATKQYVDNQVTTLAPLVHTHTVTDVTGLGTAATIDTGTAEGNIPVLTANGKLPTTVLPALAITNTFVVENQTAMLAITAEVGDIAIRTDLNKSFILAGDDPTSLSDWQELLSPTDAVSSVNGQTGAVSITLADLGGVASSAIGVADGVAPLDSNQLVPIANLPTESILSDSANLIPTSTAVYAHTNATTAHNATATPTANRIALYDGTGHLSSGLPTLDSHVITKNYLNTKLNENIFKTALTTTGVTTEFNITHNLGSREIEVLVWHTYSGITRPIQVAYQTDSANTVTLSFAIAPGTAMDGHSYVVMVRK